MDKLSYKYIGKSESVTNHGFVLFIIMETIDHKQAD